ncbi:hypothetical protein [Brenneria izadpanahii]|uniref:hypothetical protein n=1 Tax=Brenneria izadpanahii TaxID=2722756 RepID=UPI001AAFF4EB
MLFTPYRMGDLTLPNRIVMPPMTRSRAGAASVAVDIPPCERVKSVVALPRRKRVILA